jgi:sugar phosphate isomerase/epimerase
MITLTGIGDEAGNPLGTQIKATQALGWSHIEMRNVEVPGFPSGNVHDIPDAAFDQLAGSLADHGISISGFGSTIGNWASQITDDFSVTLERADRAIPRMQRLGTRLVRVMSYAVLKDEHGHDLPDQHEAERFRRLRELKRRFDDAGLVMVHENCMNYGGMSISHALRCLEEVPGLRWVFDTCNPIFNMDRDNPPHMQDPWEFYKAVKPAISHIHIKDGTYNPARRDADYTLPGLGSGRVADILGDLIGSGYDGFVSIEPHTAVVFHSAASPNAASGDDAETRARNQFDSYVSYGHALTDLLRSIPGAL